MNFTRTLKAPIFYGSFVTAVANETSVLLMNERSSMLTSTINELHRLGDKALDAMADFPCFG